MWQIWKGAAAAALETSKKPNTPDTSLLWIQDYLHPVTAALILGFAAGTQCARDTHVIRTNSMGREISTLIERSSISHE